ncbi:DNA primase large subunit [Paramuricea clavata]|uniref:DNA primase large subunit n=1 Tax=Paramuricea clavata TaxID=317549 RepID=A0A7D9DG24_PARCT|nr:DNA primase large subunit [Paramuricea clavata]
MDFAAVTLFRRKAECHSRLQMYKIPPVHKISLEDFDTIAIERLKLLRDVETFGIRRKKYSDEYSTAMWTSLRKFLDYTYSMDDQTTTLNPHYIDDLKKETVKDNTSHFILRLAYCRSEELRRWFITQEVDLFKFRFNFDAEKFENIEKFLEENSLKYTPISEEERNERSSKLASADYVSTVEMTNYYKVPFTEVLDLVRWRKVYLEKGYAYVPRDRLVSIISNCFRIHLSHALALTAKSLPYFEEDERILPRLTNLSRQYLDQSYDSKKEMPGGKIILGQIDSFERVYAYNVRHSFGKEGKRTDYTPYSCMKIIKSNLPGQGDYHGCPFRHYNANILRQKLVAYGVPHPAIKEIQDLVKRSRYQLACTRYFEITHKSATTVYDVINYDVTMDDNLDEGALESMDAMGY